MKNFTPKKFLKLIFGLMISSSLPFWSFKTLTLSAQEIEIETEISETQEQKRIEDLTDYYILGRGDILNLYIYDIPELSGELRVLKDATIQIPIVGSLKVEGMTIEQARTKITNLLGKELLRPDIFLKIERTRDVRVSVLGEVQKPGLYSFDDDKSPNSTFTIVDAIQKAGGITQTANLKEITLKRKLPGMKSDFKTTNLDLIELILNGNQKYNPAIFDGDTIIIPKINSEENRNNDLKIAAANLSPQFINVNIIGEVISPGKKELAAGSSLNQAILESGGYVNWRANKAKIKLYRINRDGSLINKNYKINLATPPSNRKNPILKNGDTIYVQTSKFASVSDGVNAIGKPVSGIVNIWSLFKLIND